MLQGETNWPLNDRINHLNIMLAEIKSRKISIARLPDEKLAMEPAAIVDNVLVSIPTFQQVDFKIQDNVTITVNEIFSHGNFISYDDFCEKIIFIHENGYLALRHHLVAIIRPSSKYGQPIINKEAPSWNIESMTKLFN